MRVEKLSNILDITMGKTPARKDPNYWGKGHKWVSIRDLKKKVITETKEEITDLALKNTGIKQVTKGTLLFSFKLTIGKIAFAGTNLYTNEAIAAFVIKDPKTLDSNYLYYALKSVDLVGSNQAAMGKTLNSKSLAAIEIPLPDDINDQKRIAHLLGKVESLINQRKQNIQQLDDLLKSVFVNMFGDPVHNDKAWDKVPLENLGSINRGISKHRPRNDPKLLGGKYPLIQTGEVSNAGVYITKHTKTYSDIGLAQSKQWPVGTLCITIAANIAKTGILTFNACFPDSVVGFMVNKVEANSLYVNGLFWFFQSILEKNAPAAGQKNINLEILRGLEVPKPPITLQNEFASIVIKVEEIKSCYQQSLNDIENLYSALSQKAFKGELDLSKVPLLDESEEISNDMSSVEQDNIAEKNKENSILGFSQFNQESIKDNELRKIQLSEWFNEWLEHYQQESDLNINHFWQCIEFTTQDYVDENDEPLKIDVSDYDHIKDEVFAAIKSGVIKQTTDMIETVVDGKTQLEPGNQILLKKQH